MTNAEIDPQPIDDPFERLAIFQENQHFLPLSRDELSEAFALQDYLERPGGSAKHLIEIYHHQQDAQTDDPAKAVRAVTLEYVSYLTSARVSMTHLDLLRKDVDDTDKPSLSLYEAAGSNVGFGELVRFIDLRQLARDQVVSQEEIDPLRADYLANLTPQMIAHINEVIRNIHVKEARALVPLAIADQRARGLFWKDRLRECEMYTLAKPIAKAALKSNIDTNQENS